jgi:hypothetical protein
MSTSDHFFDTSVFINCPFDDDYLPLLRPILFTILYLGLRPRIVSERFDSGETRISKICELIQASKYSIHDLSRMESAKENELYRMNMPFELGIDIGCRLFAVDGKTSKKCLILEAQKFRYQKALSDMASSDIKNHNNEPEQAVREIRNWFVEIRAPKAPSGTRIWEDFNEFMADFYLKREQGGYKEKDLTTMPV